MHIVLRFAACIEVTVLPSLKPIRKSLLCDRTEVMRESTDPHIGYTLHISHIDHTFHARNHSNGSMNSLDKSKFSA